MRIEFHKEGKPLYHMWSNCIGAGRANEGLRADWQQHLRTVTEECGFRYLRFHGLLHDDMHVYTVQEDGTVHYNFQYVDKVYDYMLSCGIRPIVEFGFMPLALASNERTQFWWKGNVAPPNDYEKWGELIDRLVRHWIWRYGIEEVSGWLFEVWNEPNLICFWSGTKSQYFQLYKTTAEVIKRIDPRLKVGGPATSNYVPDSRFEGETEDMSVHETFRVEDLNTLPWRGAWIEDFLAFCEREKLPLDFISTHPYPTDFALDGYGESRGRTRYKDSLRDDILWLKNVLAQSAYPDIPIHLTEWSSSPSSRDYSHDYLPEAAYIVRSNLECLGLVDSLSYWVFTDVFEELGAGPAPFHGGFGIVNLQGIKKPSFHAYRMLSHLGETELEKGDGYLFSRKADKLQAIFCHYPEEYRDTPPMSAYPDQTKAQECQAVGTSRAMKFEITGLNPGDVYTLRVLRKEHLPVTLWNEMGAPAELSFAQEKQLLQRGEMLEEQEFIVASDGILNVGFELEAWNIAELGVK